MIMNDIRKLINILEAIEQGPDEDSLSKLKTAISHKIKELPPDDATIKALREIEDLLRHVNAGGRMGIINGELQSIDDPTVHAAQKELARYILSMDMDPKDRDELFNLWRADKLVKRDVLLSGGKKNFSQIINKYDSNPAIKELVNELMRIAALGQGKGEFGLSVLSKSITKPDKGDLLIGNRHIEVKTTDGGAGRFTDQEVRPGPGFEQAARRLNDFIRQYHPSLAKSGANLEGIVNFYEVLKTNPDMKAEAAEFIKMVNDVIGLVFYGENVKPITDSIESGNINKAKQEYAKTNFNYYMKKKIDEGVLYISLGSEPIMSIFFKDADDLAKAGMRLHAGTIYPTSVADIRLPYPQIEIVDTSGEMVAGNGSSSDLSDVDLTPSNDKGTKQSKYKEPETVSGSTHGVTGLRPQGANQEKPVSAPRARR
jgi:hypothetical protein